MCVWHQSSHSFFSVITHPGSFDFWSRGLYISVWSFNGISNISEFQGWGLKRCLPINYNDFAIKINTFAFSSFSPHSTSEHLPPLPGSEPSDGANTGSKASHSISPRGADSNLLLKPDSHWEDTLATCDNEHLLPFTHTLNSITAAEEISSVAWFSTNAHELYQRLIDQLNGRR